MRGDGGPKDGWEAWRWGSNVYRSMERGVARGVVDWAWGVEGRGRG